MQASSFPCPYCSASLRIKDRSLVGRKIDCPDCGRSLLVVSDGPRSLAARKPAVTSTETASVKFFSNPAVIGWSTAGMVALILVTFFWKQDRGTSQQKPLAISDQADQTGDETASSNAHLSPDAGTKIGSQIPEKPNNDETIDAQLLVATDVQALEDHKNNQQPVPQTIGDSNTAPKVGEPTQPVLNANPAEDPHDAPSITEAEKKPSHDFASQPAAVPAKTSVSITQKKDLPVDIHAALKQKIARYHLPRAFPVRRLLSELEEMAAVPIDVTKLDSASLTTALETPVTVSMKDTNIGEILTAILKKVNLRYSIQDEAIRIESAKSIKNN